MLKKKQIEESIREMNNAILYGDLPHLSLEYKEGIVKGLLYCRFGDKSILKEDELIE